MSDLDYLISRERSYPFMARVKSFGLNRLAESVFGEHISVPVNRGEDRVFAFRVEASRNEFLKRYTGSEVYDLKK